MKVQRGTTTLTGTTATITLATPVEVGKSFVIHSQSINDTTSPEAYACQTYLDDVVGGKFTKVQIQRNNSGGTIYIYWQVVESSDFTVQYGTATTDTNVTISSVSTSKSFPIISARCSGSFNGRAFVQADITSATNLSLTSGTTGAVVRWQVVEWEGATVAKYSGSASGSSATTTITQIDTSKAFIYGMSFAVSSSLFSANPGAWRFNSTTQVLTERGTTSGSISFLFYVVTPPESTVYTNVNSWTTFDDTSVEVSLSPNSVKTDNTMLVTSWWGYVTNANAGPVQSAGHNLKNSTTLEFVKDADFSTGINYFAVEVGELEPSFNPTMMMHMQQSGGIM
jgi:hypothetical protein